MSLNNTFRSSVNFFHNYLCTTSLCHSFFTSLFHLDLSILFFFWLRKGLIQLMVLTHVIFLDQKKKKKKVLLAAIHYTKGFIHTFVLWITLVKDRQAVILDRVSDLRPSFGQAGMSFFFKKKKYIYYFG